MNVREMLEEQERIILSPYAALSINTIGREREEEKCDMRTEYQRDKDRVIHCKAFRRLKHKTQVFLAPEGDHYRTRLTHTLEVSQIARSISRALRLNEDLTEAISLAHDLGHTPFGHAGERALNDVCRLGFMHSEQSVRVVEKLEKKGLGLNLTKEVRDGIANHGINGKPMTLEGKVVKLADKIAYINHDTDDAIRAKILCEEDIPYEFASVLGKSTSERLDTLIHDIVINSINTDDVKMSPTVATAMSGLRQFMFKNVYNNPIAKSQEIKAEDMIKKLYTYYVQNPDKIPGELRYLIEERGEDVERVVCDYIAGMSDQYSVAKFQEAFVPLSWSK